MVRRRGCTAKSMNVGEFGKHEGTNGAGVLSIILYSGLSLCAMTWGEWRGVSPWAGILPRVRSGEGKGGVAPESDIMGFSDGPY